MRGLRKSPSRSGVAAVECALAAPVLMLLVLGAIDIGQYANVHQKVSDASREGVRVGSALLPRDRRTRELAPPKPFRRPHQNGRYALCFGAHEIARIDFTPHQCVSDVPERYLPGLSTKRA